MRTLDDRWLAAGLFFLFIAASPGRIIAFDVGVRTEMAHALWTRASVFIPAGSSVETGLVHLAGNPGGTSFYGMGQSLLLIPFDILGSLLGEPLRPLPTVFLYIPLAGLWWWFTTAFLLETLGLARAVARRWAAVFACATIVFVYSTQTAQEESLVGALAVTSLAFWLRALKEEDRATAWKAGALAAFALLVRLNSFWILLPLAGATCDAARKNARAALRLVGVATLGALPVLTVLGVFAKWRYGRFFATGYDAAAAEGLGVFWTAFQWDVFAGLWVGLGKGLFILSPLLLLALGGWKSAWRRAPFLGAGIALAFVGSTVLCGFIANNPDGSECWGARYQVHLLGLVAYPTYLGFQRLLALSRAAAGTLLALSVALQLLSLTAPDAYEYIQNDDAALSRTALITGGATGQLGRRLANVSDWVRGEIPAEAALRDLRARFVPNFWGASYAVKAPSPLARLAVFFLWMAVAGLAATCLTRARMGWLGDAPLHEKRRTPVRSFSWRKAH